jgi:hypothetical protein
VTGLGVGRVGSSEVPFYSHGQKVKYYDSSDDDTHETGTRSPGLPLRWYVEIAARLPVIQ